MDKPEIDKRFDYHAPTEVKRVLHEDVRTGYKLMAIAMDEMLPESREKSLAFTALEESLMWANACIARNDLT